LSSEILWDWDSAKTIIALEARGMSPLACREANIFDRDVESA